LNVVQEFLVLDSKVFLLHSQSAMVR
jgi:hypothetical protein